MGGGKGAERAAQQARQDEKDREQRIQSGTAAIRNMFKQKFTDHYYDNLAKTGNELYKPEVVRQFGDSLNDLKAALYRSGNAASSAGVGMETALGEQRDRALQDIEGNVRGVVNQRRQNVANAELQAIGQLQSSADAGSAASQAQNMISLNTKPEAWSPLGQVFTDVTAGLATQGQLEREGRNRYSVGVSNWMGGSPRRYTANVGGA